MKNKTIIIGAGPGGLVAGLILQHHGFNVEIFEKNKIPGGRNSYINIDGHKFDVGPTFLMMKYILDEVFTEIGLKTEDHLNLTRLSPMYRLYYKDKEMDIYEEKDKMKKEIEKNFPGEGKSLDKFYKIEERRFKYLMPCLQKDYSGVLKYFNKYFIKAIPFFSIPKTLYQILGNYFKNEDLKISFTFQSKYLGMSPWQCPAAFAMIPYVEHAMGIYHVEGGLSNISEKMAEIFIKIGGIIHYNKKVEKVFFKEKAAKGINLNDGTEIKADDVIINADFGYAMNNLIPDGLIKKYSKEKVANKKYSCSTFMLYLGLKKEYNIKHHSIIFAPQYKKNVEEIFSGKMSGENISMYIRNASVTDKTVSPEGKSQLYILLPVPNKKLGSEINWEKEKQEIRNIIIKTLKERLGLKDIEEQIETEKIITPNEWVDEYNVFFGATFNLSHNLTQMLSMRPHNKLEEVNNCYLVGGGTHPGSGLPTIYESGRITARMIMKKYK